MITIYIKKDDMNKPIIAIVSAKDFEAAWKLATVIIEKIKIDNPFYEVAQRT